MDPAAAGAPGSRGQGLYDRSRVAVDQPVVTVGAGCDSDGRVTTVTGSCDSCGRDDEPLTEVRRVYITPEAWDREGRVDPAPDTERWCEVCQAHYPHQPADQA